MMFVFVYFDDTKVLWLLGSRLTHFSGRIAQKYEGAFSSIVVLKKYVFEEKSKSQTNGSNQLVEKWIFIEKTKSSILVKQSKNRALK